MITSIHPLTLYLYTDHIACIRQNNTNALTSDQECDGFAEIRLTVETGRKAVIYTAESKRVLNACQSCACTSSESWETAGLLESYLMISLCSIIDICTSASLIRESATRLSASRSD